MISPVPSHQFNSIGLTPIHQNVDKEIEHNQHITFERFLFKTNSRRG